MHLDRVRPTCNSSLNPVGREPSRNTRISGTRNQNQNQTDARPKYRLPRVAAAQTIVGRQTCNFSPPARSPSLPSLALAQPWPSGALLGCTKRRHCRQCNLAGAFGCDSVLWLPARVGRPVASSVDAAACRLSGSPGAPSPQHALALGQPASSCCPVRPRASRRWNGWDLIHPRPGDGGISVLRHFGWQTTHARSGRVQQRTAGYPTLPCRTICVDPRSPRSRPRGHPHTELPPSCFSRAASPPPAQDTGWPSA